MMEYLFLDIEWNAKNNSKNVSDWEPVQVAAIGADADLKAENDEAYKRLSTSVDLESVKKTALEELGMSYVKESQIVYYSVGDDDYMNQYGDIPAK